MTDEELQEFKEFQEWKKKKAEENKKVEEKLSSATEKSVPATTKPNNDANNGNNGCLVAALIVPIVFIIIIIIFGIAGNNENEPSGYDTSQDSMMAYLTSDTPTDAEAYQHKLDSIDAAEKVENEKIAARLKPKMRFKKDEFEKGTTWVYPKTAAKYVNINDVYCYFCIVDGVAQNFRFCIQYLADDWLFIQSYKFNVDDFLFDYIPDEIKRDNDSRIWEWSDQRVQPLDNSLIIALTTAKSAKVQFIGRDYKKSKTITRKQLDAIRDIYDYYKAIGGKL